MTIACVDVDGMHCRDLEPDSRSGDKLLAILDLICPHEFRGWYDGTAN